MKLVITRPSPDAERLANKLEPLGVECLVAPLIEIRFRSGVDLPVPPVQAVLVTSANGVRALQHNDGVQIYAGVPVLTVGDASAQAARMAGFDDVRSAAGDLAALVDLVRARLNPEHGVLLYAAGATRSGDLAGLLTKAGFQVEPAVLYDAIAAETLPSMVHENLEAGGVTGIVLMSPRSAKIWAGLVGKAGLAAYPAGLCHYCLSAQVARQIAAMPGMGPSCIKIAEHPNEAAMIDLIATDAACT